MEWISVKDDLPAKGKSCIFFGYMVFMGICNDPEKCEAIEDNIYTHSEKFTHWMPLPKPPEK